MSASMNFEENYLPLEDTQAFDFSELEFDKPLHEQAVEGVVIPEVGVPEVHVPTHLEKAAAARIRLFHLQDRARALQNADQPIPFRLQRDIAEELAAAEEYQEAHRLENKKSRASWLGKILRRKSAE